MVCRRSNAERSNSSGSRTASAPRSQDASPRGREHPGRSGLDRGDKGNFGLAFGGSCGRVQMRAYLGHDLFGAAGPRLPAAFAAGAASAAPGWWRGPDGDLVPGDLLVDGDGHGSPRRIAEAALSAVFVLMGRKVVLYQPPRSQPRSVMGEPTGLGAGRQISTFSGRRDRTSAARR